jgi:hypothetical protein
MYAVIRLAFFAVLALVALFLTVAVVKIVIALAVFAAMVVAALFIFNFGRALYRRLTTVQPPLMLS